MPFVRTIHTVKVSSAHLSNAALPNNLDSFVLILASLLPVLHTVTLLPLLTVSLIAAAGVTRHCCCCCCRLSCLVCCTVRVC
jgi:hypothetical protein